MKKNLLTTLFMWFLMSNVTAQLKITEIMYNPRSDEDDWEYVELYNSSNSAIDLAGYVIDDGNGWYVTSPNITKGSVPAKGTVVLYNADDVEADSFKAAWGSSIDLIAVSNWQRMGLNNSGDDVALWSSMSDYGKDTMSPSGITFGNSVNHVEYDDDGTVWPIDDSYSSIQLTATSADNSIAKNWALSNTTDGYSFEAKPLGGNSGEDVGSPGKQVSSSSSNSFTLQLLHYADVDGNESVALDAVDEFSGVVNGLKNDSKYGSNTLLVTSGDIMIPGPRFYASENNKVRGVTGSNEPGHLDIFFANKMGVDVASVGNHELDAGPGELYDAAFSSESRNGVNFPGSEFPWLATNIDFSQDDDFKNAIGQDGESISKLHSKVAKYAVTEVNGETIGLIGAVSPTFPTITSTGSLVFTPSNNWTNQDLAKEIQKSVDSLKSMGVEKIILLSHMQQLSVEKSLAKLLDGVDIIVAGGSNTRMGDSNDVLYSSSLTSDASFDETYPFLTTDASGDPVAVVNVDGDYKYLGRLVVEFDKDGKLITSSIDKNVSGAFASISSNISAVGGKSNQKVIEARDSVLAVIDAQYQNIVGYSSVYLDGRRGQVRTQETNLGNLSADANLWYANQLNPSNDDPVLVSIKNGGGIRTEIGTSKLPPGKNDPADMEFFAPEDNAVTEGHLRATLRFNNGLVRLTLTAKELKDVMEHAFSGVAPGATNGAFPQISGMSVVYNPTGKPSQVSKLEGSNGDDSIVVTTPGERVVRIIITNADGSTTTIVENGKLMVSPTMPINVVTLNFLANGGDGYPFTIANFTKRRINYYDGKGYGENVDFPDGVLTNDPGKSTDISSTGGEQDAIAEYMLANYPKSSPYAEEETDSKDDKRIMRTLRVLDQDASAFTDVLPVKKLGSFQVPGDVFDESAAEIPAWDAERNQIFFTDANSDVIHVLDVSDPLKPSLKKTISLGGSPNSVAVNGDIVAVAVESKPKQDPGKVEFYSADDFSKTGEVTVGSLPDMVTFNEDGTKVLTANEGEPSGDYLTDPEGSISIITLNKSNLSSSTVATAGFSSYNSNIPDGVRVFGRSSAGEGDAADDYATTLAQDIEPEYITVKGNKAYVTCQENNALAIVDIDKAIVENLISLGTKDHSITGNGLDASNKDDGIFISTWPIKGMYLPDAIASFQSNDNTYLITANEGDAREYLYDDANGEEVLSFIDETRVKDLKLDPLAFPYADLLQQNDQLGRLKTSMVDGDIDNDGDHDEIYTYGTRSFTIWDAATGSVVWDSKNDLEQITKQRNPDFFNATNDENNFDDRSDDKGPEPEGVTVGMVNDRMYSFVGLERVGGIAMYDITDPINPTFAHYVNARDYTGDPEKGTAGHLAPEGMVFIPAEESPNQTALLVVTYEVSGSVVIFELGTKESTSLNDIAREIGLQVAPNPTSNTVTFVLNNTDDAELIMYNSLGTVAYNQQFNSSITVSKDDLNSGGIYFYEVNNHGVTESGKVIILK